VPEVESDRDELLARLLGDLSEEQRRGGSPDVESAARQHPELAEELRQLWAAAQLADELALSATTRDQAGLRPRPARPGPGPALPRSFGGYELREELGRGGMGIVYKAWDPALQRTVALKVVRAGELASDDDLARFRAEAQAAAGLAHENIVPIYSVSEQQGQPYFTMKYVEGVTLSQLLAKGPLSGRDAVRTLLPIAEAVQHAHAQGILHRDLKPSNILIDQEGKPHVTDFGLAKVVTRSHWKADAAHPVATLTRTGAILGTPSYMPPEQAAGSRGTVGPAADVYALGAILYEMLTGRPPFQAASAMDTLLLVLEQEPVPPRALNPKVDRELEAVCLKCLQKPAGLRYASAGELAADLRAFLQGESLSVGAGGLTSFLGRMFRETHQAAVLENWGLLWMWHSLKILLLCLATNVLLWRGVSNRLAYLLLWSVGLVTWGGIFWALRRRGGPVTFVERQIAHVWAASVAASISVFAIEVLLTAVLHRQGVELPVLVLTPLLAVFGGMVFLIKGGMLSGSFYLASAALFLTAVPMALLPSVAPLLFGIVSAACFFFPGLKYHRQRLRSARLAGASWPAPSGPAS
jgi:serine/threonine-protein kinase